MISTTKNFQINHDIALTLNKSNTRPRNLLIFILYIRAKLIILLNFHFQVRITLPPQNAKYPKTIQGTFFEIMQLQTQHQNQTCHSKITRRRSPVEDFEILSNELFQFEEKMYFPIVLELNVIMIYSAGEISRNVISIFLLF